MMNFIDKLHWFLMFFGVATRNISPEVMDIDNVFINSKKRITLGTIIVFWFAAPPIIHFLPEFLAMTDNTFFRCLIYGIFMFVFCYPLLKIDSWEEERYGPMFDKNMHLEYYSKWSSLSKLKIYLIRFFVISVFNLIFVGIVFLFMKFDL